MLIHTEQIVRRGAVIIHVFLKALIYIGTGEPVVFDLSHDVRVHAQIEVVLVYQLGVVLPHKVLV